jgi:hypothetical protein
LALHLEFLGRILNLYLQHGQRLAGQSIKTSHFWHRFWPVAYLPALTALTLWRMQIPLHAIAPIDWPVIDLFIFLHIRLKIIVTKGKITYISS